MAVDHPWTKNKPDLLIQGSENSLKHSPQNFFKVSTLHSSHPHPQTHTPFLTPCPNLCSAIIFGSILLFSRV